MSGAGAGVPRSRARSLARALVALLVGVPGALVLVLAVSLGAASARERVPRAARAPAAGRLVPSGDLRLFVQEAGPADGRLVVLVHGTGAWGEIWRPVADALARAGFHVVAVDMPPFGFSDRSRSGAYSVAAQAGRLGALLDELRADSVILVGHSFGARATLQAALADPGRVARVVLVDAALSISDTTSAPAPAPLGLQVALSARPVRAGLVAATVTNPLLTRTFTGQLVAFPDRLTDAQIEMLQRPMRQPGTSWAAGAWIHDFLLEPAPPVREARRALANLPAPVHVVWGELDSLTPVAQGQDLARLARCATWDVLPGTGHIPGLEAPDLLARTLVTRLSAPPPRCAAAR
ncbi:MAG: alpha/beta fold hydrolase [Gemmatimonadaceae bacterium]